MYFVCTSIPTSGLLQHCCSLLLRIPGWMLIQEWICLHVYCLPPTSQLILEYQVVYCCLLYTSDAADE